MHVKKENGAVTIKLYDKDGRKQAFRIYGVDGKLRVSTIGALTVEPKATNVIELREGG